MCYKGRSHVNSFAVYLSFPRFEPSTQFSKLLIFSKAETFIFQTTIGTTGRSQT